MLDRAPGAGSARPTRPKLAFFTGRDQMQALTGLWAQQFGTPNYAAHGGFCSVNMAAARDVHDRRLVLGIRRARLGPRQVLRHVGRGRGSSSNPLKIGLDKLKRRGAQLRLDQSGAHRLLGDRRRMDTDPARHRRRCWRSRIVHDAAQARADRLGVPASAIPMRRGWSCRRPACPATACSRATAAGQSAGLGHRRSQRFAERHTCPTSRRRCSPRSTSPTAAAPRPSFSLARGTLPRRPLRAGNVAAECGVAAQTIRSPRAGNGGRRVQPGRRTADPLDRHARARSHDTGRRPPGGDARHARHRGALQRLSHLPRAARAADAARRDSTGPAASAPARRIRGASRCARCPKTIPRSFRARIRRSTRGTSAIRRAPEDLVIDAQGKPLRIDQAFSWEYPLAAHGMMHMVITNAVNGDPYRIDTLLMFMANMAWNSAMNTGETRDMLVAQGRRRRVHDSVPRRRATRSIRKRWPSPTWCCPTRPISSATTRSRCSTGRSPSSMRAADAIRHPVVAPDRDVRPFQEVLVELASRLKFPAFIARRRRAHASRTTRTSSSTTKRRRASAFWPAGAARTASKALRGEPNPKQWEKYIENKCVLHLSAGPRTCDTSATRTRTISSSRSGTRCSEPRRCR